MDFKLIFNKYLDLLKMGIDNEAVLVYGWVFSIYEVKDKIEEILHRKNI